MGGSELRDLRHFGWLRLAAAGCGWLPLAAAGCGLRIPGRQF